MSSPMQAHFIELVQTTNQTAARSSPTYYKGCVEHERELLVEAGIYDSVDWQRLKIQRFTPSDQIFPRCFTFSGPAGREIAPVPFGSVILLFSSHACPHETTLQAAQTKKLAQTARSKAAEASAQTEDPDFVDETEFEGDDQVEKEGVGGDRSTSRLRTPSNGSRQEALYNVQMHFCGLFPRSFPARSTASTKSSSIHHEN
ncbi:hypothetical protein R3P38DRAFT_2803381 [Favolaschia claudopus]|uniref:Uncharacterized protein n=1 Tax=Favolaschia claudopus TaxID=2862362 RepID=A0AAV9ZT53_9AGAR